MLGCSSWGSIVKRGLTALSTLYCPDFCENHWIFLEYKLQSCQSWLDLLFCLCLFGAGARSNTGLSIAHSLEIRDGVEAARVYFSQLRHQSSFFLISHPSHVLPSQLETRNYKWLILLPLIPSLTLIIIILGPRNWIVSWNLTWRDLRAISNRDIEPRQ